MKAFVFIFSLFLLCACAKSVFKSKWVKEQAPEKFTARFETSKGSFDVELVRSYSPRAVDRVYQLIKHRFFDKAIFYRADSGFVVQFGTNDSTRYNSWDRNKIPDEQVTYGNKKGTISFARAGKETRGTDMFINLKDNLRLDTSSFGGVKGFPALGIVTDHFEVVQSIYTGYGDSTMKVYDSLFFQKTAFQRMFPKLDSIRKVYILK